MPNGALDPETIVRCADGKVPIHRCDCEYTKHSSQLKRKSERRSPDFWDRFFLNMADHVATASRDPSTKVGCVLVDDRRRLVGMGYNGFPRGVDDWPERYEDRPTKYLMVQHAEANAVLQSPAAYLEGSTAYVTHPPCANCAGILIQAGIKRVVTYLPCPELAKRFADSWEAAETMFDEVGISVTFLEPLVEVTLG